MEYMREHKTRSGGIFRWSAGNMHVFICVFIQCIFLAVLLTGCKVSRDNGKKVRDLEFTVITEQEAPEELRSIISEKMTQPFKMTYSDGQNLFIVVGYGPQETGGFSIAAEELYLTENSIVIDTELLGPKKGETPAAEKSYPYVIVKTENLENPVIFK